jgi:hypothetical protein
MCPILGGSIMLKSKQSRFISVTRSAPVRKAPKSPMVISAALLDWEREIYTADSLGGAPSRY